MLFHLFVAESRLTNAETGGSAILFPEISWELVVYTISVLLRHWEARRLGECILLLRARIVDAEVLPCNVSHSFLLYSVISLSFSLLTRRLKGL